LKVGAGRLLPVEEVDSTSPTCLPCVEEAVQSTCEQQYLMCMVD
jgi:hypothetical protein